MAGKAERGSVAIEAIKKHKSVYLMAARIGKIPVVMA